ncbi:MAG TPA: NYN domain-containing protein [Acidimicrobiia bacterium]
MTHLVVDGMNVIGSRPDGWWRDRAGAARRLHARLARLAAAEGDGITLVLDGRPRAELPEGVHDDVAVAYARRGGRNAADDRIVELVRTDPDPRGLTVVTSDRDLADRVSALGAAVIGAGELLRRLDEIDEP